MQLEDWLDDLCVRFIINLPEEDLSSVARICFQVEEAQWFYEDFIRPLDPTLPSMSLRSFCLRIFQHCPLLAPFSIENHMAAFEEFLQYKTRIPVRGAILLNEAMDCTVLVKGWKKGANWSFPRGKINKDEDDLDCAIREVYEETGFDLRAADLVPEGTPVKHIDITMREQQMRLYVFRNVPMDTHFAPRTRKEISKIQWYNLSELPAFRKKGNQIQNAEIAANQANKFYMVAPFLVPLKKWITQQKKEDVKLASEPYLVPPPHAEETATEDDAGNVTEAMDGARHGPAPEALEKATRELQRLLKVQPFSQGVQLSVQPPPAQNNAGALLALLQSESVAQNASSSNENLHTPLDQTIPQAPEPATPHHHHPAQHPPLANQSYPPPHFQIPSISPCNTLRSGEQPQAGDLGPLQYRPNNLSRPVGNLPTLVHPQPLPPQVQQSLLHQGLFNYATPPPKAASASQESHLSQLAAGLQADLLAKPPGNAPPPQYQVTSLNSHSKSLLDVFKGTSSQISVSTRNVVQPYKQESGLPGLEIMSNAVAASQPYQQVPSHPVALASQPALPTFNGLGNRAHGPSGEKHRSALLQMFKTASSDVQAVSSPSAGNIFVSSTAVPKQPQPVSDQAPQAPLAALPSHAAPKHPGSLFGRPTVLTGVENVVPQKLTAAGPAASQPIWQILKRPDAIEKPTVITQSKMVPLPTMSTYDIGSSKDMPSSQATAPAAATLPTPTIFRRQEASSEHKQKLLSLFGNQEPSPKERVLEKGKAIDFGMGQAAPQIRFTSAGSGLGDASPIRAPTSGSGHQTPISPADRNFLLGYLQSATSQVGR